MCIVGSQSSGKTTILNEIFKTDFQVMDVKNRKQTTEGIFMFVEEEKKIVVFDVEGSDSRERLMVNNGIQNKLFLFSLAISNIVMINMWTHDLGRFQASNYQILRQSFELNLRHFNQDQKKKLIFLLRDFSSQENFKGICDMLQQDILQIWNSIQKPIQFSNVSCFQLFEFQVIPIAHKFHDHENFLYDINDFAERIFFQQKQGYLFQNIPKTNVPLESFYEYCQNIWNKIDSDQDLNLVKEKILISVYRCCKVKDKILNKCAIKFKELSSKIQQNKQVFKQEYIDICHALLDEYDSDTFYYDQQKANEIRVQLEASIDNEFEKIFYKQNEKIIDQYIQEMQKEIDKYFNQQSGLQYQKLQFIEQKNSEFITDYVNFLSDFKFKDWKKNNIIRNFKSQWSQKFIGFVNILANQIIEEISAEQLQTYQAFVHQTFLYFDKEGIQFLNDHILKDRIKFSNSLQDLKNKFDTISPILDENFCNQKCQSFLNKIKDMVLEQTQNINLTLYEEFKREFLHDQRGKEINWTHCFKSQIEQRFQQIYQKYLSVALLYPPIIEMPSLDIKLLEFNQNNKISKKLEKECKDLYNSILYKRNSFRSDNTTQTLMTIIFFVATYLVLPNFLFKIFIAGTVIYYTKNYIDKLKKFSSNEKLRLMTNAILFIFNIIKQTISKLSNQFQNQNNQNFTPRSSRRSINRNRSYEDIFGRRSK